jgi:RNA polymerase sigma factor (sigma-70 family)
MGTGPISEVVQHLRRTALLHDSAGWTDGQLLGDYLSRRDEAALATLVRRHGPMVWGVCRRVLGDYHDAEDAFQATFLVFVRKAGSIASRELLANWLHGVARQTALKARAIAAKRKMRERPMTVIPERAGAEADRWNDLQPLLDRELSRLPIKYRTVILLCDLESKTRKEAAQQLGLPEGTVASRLGRARAMLTKRLAQHGLAVSGGALATTLSQHVASARVPNSVALAAIEAASLFAAGQASAAGAISAPAATLAEGVLKTMVAAKLKSATAMSLVFVLLCAAGLLASHAGDGTNIAAVQKQLKKDDEKLKDTLLALDTEYWDAWTKGKGDGDRKVVDRLLAESYLGIWASDPPIDKAAGLEGLKRYRYSDRTIRDVDARRVGKDTAVLTYLCSLKACTDNEEPVALEFRGSYVWTRRDGGWVLALQIAHPLAANDQQELPPLFGR